MEHCERCREINDKLRKAYALLEEAQRENERISLNIRALKPPSCPTCNADMEREKTKLYEGKAWREKVEVWFCFKCIDREAREIEGKDGYKEEDTKH